MRRGHDEYPAAAAKGGCDLGCDCSMASCEAATAERLRSAAGEDEIPGQLGGIMIVARSLALGWFVLALPATSAEPQPARKTAGIEAEIDGVVQPLLKGKKGVGVVVAIIDRQGQRVFGYG